MSPLLRKAAVAGTLGGLPSTVWTLARHGDVLASTRAAGTLLDRRSSASPTARLAAGVLVHALISIGWTAVLTRLLPRRAVAGAVAGLAIGVLDRRLARRLAPEVAALPRVPQLADHVAFGVLVATVGRPVSRGPALSAGSAG